MSKLINHVLRLKPGQDLRNEMLALARRNDLRASVVLSGVGSLKTARLRYAGAQEPTTLDGPFEIVAMTGTLAHDGLHVHLAIANAQGLVLGGHLQEGCLIHTTCELSVLENKDLEFSRRPDPETGYNELHVYPLKGFLSF